MKKMYFSILLTVLMSMVGAKAFAYDIAAINADGVTIYYNFINDNTELEVASGGGYAGNVVIPESVTYNGNTYNVTSIGGRAFSGCAELTQVTIPNSVTVISVAAFMYCYNLAEVTIGNGVTLIASGAFSDCSSLTKIIIPSSVKNMASLVFDKCSNLTEVTFSDGNDELVLYENIFGAIGYFNAPIEKLYLGRNFEVNENGIYRYSPFRELRTMTSLVIGDSVTSIGNSAFSYCSSLTELTFGNNVASIGDYAFWNCNALTEITIPNSVTSIGNSAFSKVGLEKITVDEGNSYYDSRENCNAIIRTDENKLIAGCKNTLIPNGVTSIDDYAFSSCAGLTEITIPNSVTSIGNYAFYDCNGLTEVTIPNSVTSIGDYAFDECSNLTEIIIGSSVTLIGRDAFLYCESLLSVTSLSTTPPMVEPNDWNGIIRAFNWTTERNATLHIPTGCKEAYQQAEPWKNFLNIEDDVETGIESVTADKHSKTVIYTLDGKRLSTTNVADLPSGVYIINGKKVVVR